VRVSTYDNIAWLPLCAGLTGLGLVLSYFALRRRGPGSGLRWAAWSLLPLAAYLTGSIEMFWKMGVAVGDFAKGFVFSPKVWAGIALAGLAVVLFVVSGPMRRRAVGRDQDKQAAESGTGRALAQDPASAGRGQLATRPAATGPAPSPAKAPAKGRKARNADDDDDDLGDVADILRRHGIT
jgi:membrane protein implicated in regulation of membrane protease activity